MASGVPNSTCRDFDIDNLLEFNGKIDLSKTIKTQALTGSGDKTLECKAACIKDLDCGMWSRNGNTCNMYKVDAYSRNRFNGLIVHPKNMFNSGFPNTPYRVTSTPTKDACRDACTIDPNCNLFEFDSNDNTCTLSKCSSPFPTGYTKSTTCRLADCVKGKEYYFIDNVNDVRMVFQFDPTALSVRFYHSKGSYVPNPNTSRCATYTYSVSTDKTTIDVQSNRFILSNFTPNTFRMYLGASAVTFYTFSLNPDYPALTMIDTCNPLPPPPPPPPPINPTYCPDIFECLKGKEFNVGVQMSPGNLVDTIMKFFMDDKTRLLLSLNGGCMMKPLTISNNTISFSHTARDPTTKILVTFDFTFRNAIANPPSVQFDVVPRGGNSILSTTLVPLSQSIFPMSACTPVDYCSSDPTLTQFSCSQQPKIATPLTAASFVGRRYANFAQFVEFTSSTQVRTNISGSTSTFPFILSPATAVTITGLPGGLSYGLSYDTNGDNFTGSFGEIFMYSAPPGKSCTKSIAYCEDGSDPRIMCSDGTKPKCFDMCSVPNSICPPPFTGTLKFMNNNDYNDRIVLTSEYIEISNIRYKYIIFNTNDQNVMMIYTLLGSYFYKTDMIGTVAYIRLFSIYTNDVFIELSMYFYKKTIIAPIPYRYPAVTTTTNDCGESIINENILYHCYMFDGPTKCSYFPMIRSYVNTIHGLDEVNTNTEMKINDGDIMSYEHLLCPYEDIDFQREIYNRCTYSINTTDETMNINIDVPLISVNILEELQTDEINYYHDFSDRTRPIISANELYDNTGDYSASRNLNIYYENSRGIFIFRSDKSIYTFPDYDSIVSKCQLIKMVTYKAVGNANPPDVSLNVLYFTIINKFKASGNIGDVVWLEVSDKYGNVSLTRDQKKAAAESFFDNIRYLRISWCILRTVSDDHLPVRNLPIQSNGIIGHTTPNAVNYFIYDSQLPSGITGYNRCSSYIKSSSTPWVKCNDIFEAVEKCNLESNTMGFEWNSSKNEMRSIYTYEQTTANTGWNELVVSHYENGSYRFRSQCVDYRYRAQVFRDDNQDTYYNYHSYLVHNIFSKNCISPISDGPLEYKSNPIENKMFDVKNQVPNIPYDQNDYNVQGQKPDFRGIGGSNHVFIRSNQPHIGYRFFRGVPLFYRMNQYYKAELGELKLSPLRINITNVFQVDNYSVQNTDFLLYRTSEKFNLIGKKFEFGMGGNYFIYFTNSTTFQSNYFTEGSYEINGNTITLLSYNQSLTFDENTNSIKFYDTFVGIEQTAILSTTITSTELFLLMTTDGSIIDKNNLKTGIFSTDCLWYIVQYQRRKLFLIAFEDRSKVLEIDLSNDFSVFDIPDISRYDPISLNIIDNQTCTLKIYGTLTLYNYIITGNILTVYTGNCENDFNIIKQFGFSWDGNIYDLESDYKMIPYVELESFKDGIGPYTCAPTTRGQYWGNLPGVSTTMAIERLWDHTETTNDGCYVSACNHGFFPTVKTGCQPEKNWRKDNSLINDWTCLPGYEKSSTTDICIYTGVNAPGIVYNGLCKPGTIDYNTDECVFARDGVTTSIDVMRYGVRTSRDVMFRGSFIYLYKNTTTDTHNRANNLAKQIGLVLLALIVAGAGFVRGPKGKTGKKGDPIVKRPEGNPNKKPIDKTDVEEPKPPANRPSNVPNPSTPFKNPKPVTSSPEKAITILKVPTGPNLNILPGGSLKRPLSNDDLAVAESKRRRKSAIDENIVVRPSGQTPPKPPPPTMGGKDQAKKDLDDLNRIQQTIPIGKGDVPNPNYESYGAIRPLNHVGESVKQPPPIMIGLSPSQVKKGGGIGWLVTAPP